MGVKREAKKDAKFIRKINARSLRRLTPADRDCFESCLSRLHQASNTNENNERAHDNIQYLWTQQQHQQQHHESNTNENNERAAQQHIST